MGERHSRIRRRYGVVSLLVASTFAATSCGEDQTRDAATCLRDALAKTTIPSAQGPVRDCPSAAAYEMMQRGSGTRFFVTCTHSSGQQYLCDVRGPATQSQFSGASAYTLPGGPYTVLYDGHRVSYRPSGR